MHVISISDCHPIISSRQKVALSPELSVLIALKLSYLTDTCMQQVASREGTEAA